MATITEILADRAEAGSRYASAVEELQSAYVALAAIDAALSNSNVPLPAEMRPVRQFADAPNGPLDALPADLTHPEFAPFMTFGWRASIAAEASRIINRATA